MTEARSALAVGPADASPEPRIVAIEPALWQVLRGVRLAMLLDAPLAYGSTFTREVAFPDEVWVERAARPMAWLAFEGELPVGAATLIGAPDSPDDEANLVGMWVAPHARGRGVAGRLVETVLARARCEGLHRVVLDVAEGNVRAIGFYERVGFTRTGRVGELPHQPEMAEFEMEYLLGELPVGSG